MSRRLLAPALSVVVTAAVVSKKPGGGQEPGSFVLRWTIGSERAALLPADADPAKELPWGLVAVVNGARMPVPALPETAERVRLVDVEPGVRWNAKLLGALQDELRKVLATPMCRICAGRCVTPSTLSPVFEVHCRFCVRGRARFVCPTCHEALPLCSCIARESAAWQAVGDAAALDEDERAVMAMAADPDIIDAPSMSEPQRAAAHRLVERGLLTAGLWRFTRRGSLAMHALAMPEPSTGARP